METRAAWIPLLAAMVVLLAVTPATAVKIERGWLTLDVRTGDSHEEFKVQYSGRVREPLALTQSSKISVAAKISFSTEDFVPEFFSFRLRHNQHDNLSEPVLASYEEDRGEFRAVIDLGDPKHLRHMSGDYKLELIISDDRLEHHVRRFIADCHVTFRYSLDHPLPHDLAHSLPSTIMTEAPAVREDPPALFTGFVCVVLVLLLSGFVGGLVVQGANLRLWPASGAGFLLNLVFLGALGVVLFMLVKFWVDWTFIETLQCFLVAVLPISLAANYAFVHIKNG